MNEYDTRVEYAALRDDPMLFERLRAAARRQRAIEGSAFVAQQLGAQLRRARTLLRPSTSALLRPSTSALPRPTAGASAAAGAMLPCDTAGAAPCL